MNKTEAGEKIWKDIEKFVYQGNLILRNQNVEQEADAIDDVMLTDNSDLLRKFYLTSAELKDD